MYVNNVCPDRFQAKLRTTHMEAMVKERARALREKSFSLGR
jgi:hypothetical protein